ncbi:hypothetical protein HG535_0D05140 [Zygotorulaspora mrakii]|uniref:Serine/threonine-protein phosphatase n=1 Tax=Zygotorulaspora mrakii TaxID=42260 RepID=A0A7H9B2C1_ZYGMR|nr:uncharacterized protein HG535_0D05140 [Zygotorulaspora mrakii]QLG72805.1 hypothetical protein HG535_0D05140 [Zygotorulaspora mrakii]
MGNTGSKSAKSTKSTKSSKVKNGSKSSDGDSSASPAFTRTDTSQSVRSTRSMRSLRSRRSETNSLNSRINSKEEAGSSTVDNASEANTETPRRDGLHHRHSESDFLHQPNTLADNNHLRPSTPTSSRAQSKRSSFANTDLPPSMIQMAPKSPILKNKVYNNTNAANYNENALTDEDDDDDYDDSSSKKKNKNGGSNRSRDSISKHSTSKSQLDSVRHNISSRPSSVRSGSSSKIRRRSDNFDGHEMSPNQHIMTRTNSHASSIQTRKSSGSAGTTAYSTPLNSPGIIRRTDQQDDFIDGQDDYFGSANINVGNHTDGQEVDEVNSENDVMGEKHHHLKLPDVKNLSRRESLNEYPSNIPDIVVDDSSPSANDQRQSGPKKKRIIKPINIDETIQKLLDAGYAGKRTKNVCLKNSEISQICQLAREMFLSQPSLLELSPPVKIVGDVHGQYGDLLRLFTKCGFPPSANFLFLGDYVDRGKQSLETILLLLCYKIKYPENFFLLRGNHECANVTRVYGFYDECKRRCNIKTWKLFVDTFNTLPLAAIVAGKIFCVHGGLSPVLNSMDEIRHVSRPTDVPDFGLINDLLWSDPTDSPNEWEDNERGVSYCYNKVAINKFLNKFGFDLVCRAHMVVEDGYEFFNDRSLVTVFSAPNYCGEFDNWGAVMSVSEGLLCSFELLDPLDGAALKQVMKKGRQERKVANQQQMQDTQ